MIYIAKIKRLYYVFYEHFYIQQNLQLFRHKLCHYKLNDAVYSYHHCLDEHNRSLCDYHENNTMKFIMKKLKMLLDY